MIVLRNSIVQILHYIKDIKYTNVINVVPVNKMIYVTPGTE